MEKPAVNDLQALRQVFDRLRSCLCDFVLQWPAEPFQHIEYDEKPTAWDAVVDLARVAEALDQLERSLCDGYLSRKSPTFYHHEQPWAEETFHPAELVKVGD